MPTELVMPKLGMTMREGTLAEWLVADGAEVRAGQPVFRLTTEKVDTEADAPAGGVVHHVVAPGTTVASGATVGWILAPGERAPDPAGAGAGAPMAPVAPAGRRARVNASPLAKRLAEAEGVDIALLSGSGPAGRIVADDVRAALAARAPAEGATGGEGQAGEPERVPLSPMRKVIADRMHASLQGSAQLTIGMDVQMDAAWKLREQLNQAWGADTHVTFTDLVARASIVALAGHPDLNAWLEDGERVLPAGVALGVAVAVPGGLVVPVVHGAGVLGLRALSRRVAELVSAASAGRLGPDDMQGSTFTVTSLGAQGVDFFTPIVNPPNVAILGIGRVRESVAFEDDRPVRCRVMTLSLTFDHRAVDGVPAAEFLGTVRRLLEAPLALLS